jgi:hypothetical protein
MSYTYSPPDYIAFSTTTLLTNGQTYDSGVLSLLGYTQVQTDVLSNVNGTIVIDFCVDAAGSDIARTLTIPYSGGSGFQLFSAPAFTPYVRYRFTCDAAGQTDFFFDTKFMNQALSPQILGADAFIANTMTTVLNRSIITGKTEGGGYYDSARITDKALSVSIDSPRTAFGELSTTIPEPVAQADFIYGINNRLHTNSTNSGIISVDAGMAKINTTATTSANAQLQSIRYLRYRPGQGAMGRWTSLFVSNSAGSNSYSGLATPDMENAFMFGYEGTAFGIWHINNGTRTHIPQTTWNVDRMNGANGLLNQSGMTLDPTKGNIYQVKYQYLGFGAVYFYVENSQNGDLVVVHELKYANSNIVPSVRQPSLEMIYRVENTTSSTDTEVKSASYGLFLEGQRKYLGPENTYNNTKSSVTTETSIFTLRNATSYNGIANRALTRLRFITFAANVSGAAGTATLRITRNATLGGSPSYTPVEGTTGDDGVTITDGQSTISVDTAGTTVTGGTELFDAIISEGTSNTYDVDNLDIFLAPGDTLTFSASATGSATAGISLVWSEDI